MSTIKVDTVQNRSGGAVTLTGQEAIKSWLFFNQQTPATIASFNVASVTDTSAGLYNQNLTSAMAGTTDLCFSGLGHHGDGDTNARNVCFQRDKRGTHTASSIPFETFDDGDGNSLGDEKFTSTQVLGSLA